MRVRPSLLIAVLLTAGLVRAQAPPEVTWEFVGADSAKVESIVLLDPADGQPHGLPHPPLVTFDFPNIPEYYDYEDGLYRLDDPGGGASPPDPDPAWDLMLDFREPSGLYADTTGLVIMTMNGSFPLDRSTDGGETWTGVDTPECNGNGIDPRIARTYGSGRERALWIVGELCRSDDDGATWTPVPHSAPPYLRRRDLLELPPSTALPDGRLVLGVGGGVLTSDDDGSTWLASSLYQDFRWVGHDLDLARDPSHPYGGTAYVLAADFGSFDGPVVLASDDGGATWDERHRFAQGAFGLDRLDGEPEIAVLGDGSLVVGLLKTFGGPRGLDLGAVVWSGDGGATWTPLGPVASWQGEKPPAGACNPACPDGAWPGWGAQLLRVDRAGRVWAGTGNGVWRTTGPAWAVASESDPEAPPASVGVSVHPNPSGRRAVAVLSLASPQVVRVSVVDAVGREVSVVFAGAARDGNRVEVETGALAPGVYRVVVEGEAGTASSGLTVVR